MANIEIITKDWNMVQRNDFIVIKPMRAREDDENGRPLFELVGIINADNDNVVLYHSTSLEKVGEALNIVAQAIINQRLLVDLREPEEDKSKGQVITIIPNQRNKNSGNN